MLGAGSWRSSRRSLQRSPPLLQIARGVMTSLHQVAPHMERVSHPPARRRSTSGKLSTTCWARSGCTTPVREVALVQSGCHTSLQWVALHFTHPERVHDLAPVGRSSSSTRPMIIFYFFLNHNAPKHLQSLHSTLQHLIRTMHAIWTLKMPNS